MSIIFSLTVIKLARSFLFFNTSVIADGKQVASAHIPKSKFPPVGVNGGNVPTDESGSGTAKSTRTGTENTDAHNPARNAKSQNPKFNNIPNGRRSAPTAFPARTKFSDRVKKLKSAARSINVEEVKKFVSERYGPLQARFSATHIRFSNVVRNEQKRRAKQAVEAYNNVKAEFNKVVDMIWKPVSEKDSTGVPPSYSNGPAEPPPEAPPRYTPGNGGMPRPHATHPPPATTPRYHPNGPGPVRNAARTSQSPGTPVFTPISMASPRSAEGWRM